MTEIFEFFKHIAHTYGPVFAVGLLLLVLIFYGVYFLIKTFPDLIREYIQKKISEDKYSHAKGTAKRKNVSPQIQKILSNLLVETDGDRALLFEFSNGKSNLAGLPFLFLNATSESLSVNTSSVAHMYQRMNISLFADFIIELEKTSYFYAEDIEDIKCKYPFIYNLMKPNGVKSMLFYSIYGVDDTLGFIVLTSTKKTFARKDALPVLAEKVQMVSSLLNLEDLEEKIK